MWRTWCLCAVGLMACPPVNSAPCSEDADCSATQRCRLGACGPLCLDDTECGPSQVCLTDGTCGARPECTRDEDCATGFTCAAGKCACEDDSACAANQQCQAGVCQSRPRCTGDADCLNSRERCEVTQGVCLPQCVIASDCAPSLDPRVAFLLYACNSGTCTRLCTTDVQCGGAGLICSAGLCQAAECTQQSDCGPGKYCTSATFGRCEAYTVCAQSSECPRNFECRAFTEASCPPGFDCSQRICQELPRCLADGDCVTGTVGMFTQTGYCAEAHCRPTSACVTTAQCGQGEACIGGLCVPGVCRGNGDCAATEACVKGACAPQPTAAQINLLQLSPLAAMVLEGEHLQLELRGYRLDGTGTPLSTAAWTVVDELGQPSGAATVSPSGLLTGVAAGTVTVRAKAGANVQSNATTVRVVPRLMMGRRVLVIDAATRLPLPGVTVRACPLDDCSAAVEVVTDDDGAAAFPLLDGQATTFTAAAPGLRGDGLPTFERASILSTTVSDVLLPLRENPVHASAGFSGSLSFADVSTSGRFWAGFIAASASDVPSLTPQRLLGDNFVTDVPGVPQQVPLPGALVLYTSPGLGIPQQVKPKSLGFAQPSNDRFVQAWAGRAELQDVLQLRSTDVLSYLSAFDYQQARDVRISAVPDVPDQTDVDGDGLCADATKCPMGSEEVPDYAHFTPLAMRPAGEQLLRTEVVLPGVPSNLQTVLVASALFDPWAGMLPTGFASRTPGAPGNDGLRTVDPIVVRGGAATNGLEVAQPGIWALAADASGSAVTARLIRADPLPAQVNVRPFLPTPADASYLPGTRQLSCGQPTWSSVIQTGGELARASVTGSEGRHTVYFATHGNPGLLTWPASFGPGQDPTTEATFGLELVAVDLTDGVTVDQVFSTGGVTLATWSEAIDGYSRLDR